MFFDGSESDSVWVAQVSIVEELMTTKDRINSQVVTFWDHIYLQNIIVDCLVEFEIIITHVRHHSFDIIEKTLGYATNILITKISLKPFVSFLISNVFVVAIVCEKSLFNFICHSSNVKDFRWSLVNACLEMV